jgi:UDPglucose 6-dehydrogenase
MEVISHRGMFTVKTPKISVIGVGYVGLCTSVGFASRGFSVTASDVDKAKISKISSGTAPFHEPCLEELLKKAVKDGFLKALPSKTEQAIFDSDLTFIAVGTPSLSDGSIDLKYIESAAKEIGKALRKKNAYHVVIVKSTVVPGTTQGIVQASLEKESGKVCGKDFGLCMNPEFLRQGNVFEDLFNPDRLVIGEFDKKSGDKVAALYENFYGEKLPQIIRTSLATAELIKYASNSFLAAKISFINTMANLCEKIPGADVKVVASAMGLDKRIGGLFLNAGLGYGGSCFPKDIKALIACAKSLGYPLELLEEVEHVNHEQPLKAVSYAKELVGSSLKGKQVAILGLAFKADTDDMREARVIPIVNQLLKEGAKVKAYDPVAIEVAKGIFGDKIVYAKSTFECLKDADCAILVNEWEEFKKLKPEDFTGAMRNAALVDGRRIYDPALFSGKLRFKAIGLGTQ